MSTEVTLVPGDTTGPAIWAHLKPLVAKAGGDIVWDEPSATADFESLLGSARRTKVVLMGYEYGKRDEGELPPVVKLRKTLDFYANLRPFKSFPGLPGRFEDVDALLVREVSEGIYANLEHETIPGVFESLKVTTREACARIAHHAFQTAREKGRERVTIVHKSNILKKSDGLFLRTAQQISEQYPDIACDECIVDALCMKIVLDPRRFDVLLAGNLFGDIVGDTLTGLVGGPSNSPSINIGADGTALFTSGHGDAPNLVGTGHGNPVTLILPLLHLLDHVGQSEVADKLELAMNDTLMAGVRPQPLGGEATIEAFLSAVGGRL